MAENKWVSPGLFHTCKWSYGPLWWRGPLCRGVLNLFIVFHQAQETLAAVARIFQAVLGRRIQNPTTNPVE